MGRARGQGQPARRAATGGYVLFATGGKNWMIHRERLPLPVTLAPMLAAPGEPPTRDLAAWAVEFKWDGVRALAFIEAARLRLLSRTGKGITATYPEVAHVSATLLWTHRRSSTRRDRAFSGGLLLDSEALQPGRTSPRLPEALRACRADPGHLPSVDALQLDGCRLCASPTRERCNSYETVIRSVRSPLMPNYIPWRAYRRAPCGMLQRPGRRGLSKWSIGV